MSALTRHISSFTDVPAGEFKAEFLENKKTWHIPCGLALPCATQNEIGGKAARNLIKNGCIADVEGANMPTVQEGISAYIDAGILHGPGKAAESNYTIKLIYRQIS